MTLVFPESAAPPGASDRNVTPLNRAPVAPIVVIRLQYQSVASSSPTRDGKLLARMRRCFPVSALLASFFSGTRDRGRILNLFGPFQAARRLFSSLLKYPQKSLSCTSNAFHVLSCVVVHRQQRSERNLSWVTRNMLRVTKCL
jgi:hypothetical protein